MNDPFRTILISVYPVRQQALLDIVSTIQQYAPTITTDSATIILNMREIQNTISNYMETYITAVYRSGYPFNSADVLTSASEDFFQLYTTLIIDETERSNSNNTAIMEENALTIRDDLTNFQQLINKVQLLESFRYVKTNLENNLKTQIESTMGSYGVMLSFDNFVAISRVCNLPATDILITVRV